MEERLKEEREYSKVIDSKVKLITDKVKQSKDSQARKEKVFLLKEEFSSFHEDQFQSKQNNFGKRDSIASQHFRRPRWRSFVKRHL